MGYDMRLRRVPDGEAEAVAAARKELDALRFDDPAWRAAYEKSAIAERSYFRLNGRGMGSYCDRMAVRGMLCAPPRGEFPEYPLKDGYRAYAWVRYPDERKGDAPSADDIAAAEKHAAEIDAFLASHPGDCPGIPAWKFGSNDGWVVTPDECKAALVALDAARASGVAEPDDDYWRRWVDYLRLAIDHDGFEVN